MADSTTPQQHGCYTDHGVSGYGVAVKLSSQSPAEEHQVKAMAEEMMMAIAGRCMDMGAKCIGHIKSHIRTAAGTIKADTIGVAHGSFSSGGLQRPVKQIFMAVNSIVQGIPEDQVKEATLAGIHRVAEAQGLVVVMEKEHSYFDEFDYLTSDEDHRRNLEEQIGSHEEAEQNGSNDEGGDDHGDDG